MEAMSITSREAKELTKAGVTSSSRSSSVTSPGQPKTLQQEFSLVNMQIDNVTIDSVSLLRI